LSGADRTVPPPPKVGDEIYVPSAFYLSHGRDDFVGGLARVAAVKLDELGGSTGYWVEVEERPGRQYNWDWLGPQQGKLRAEYKDERAHLDPDMRREFNRDD
jgi:hypothetical protein